MLPWLQDTSADFTNNQTLLLEAAIAMILGIYFYNRQKKETEKMQKILDNQNAIIEKADKRESERKRYWVSVAVEKLRALKASHEILLKHYKQVFRFYSPLNIRIPEELFSTLTYEAQHETTNAEYDHFPKLRTAVANLHELIDSPLYVDLTENDTSKFFDDLKYAEFNMSFKNILNRICETEEHVGKMTSIIERLEKEQPKL